MEVYNAKDRLPEDNTYVVARYTGGNWSDSDDQNGVNWKVVKFVRGLSKSERDALPDSDQRKRVYSGADEGGNNFLPYQWKEFGPGSFFGQEVDYWMMLPIRL